MSPESNALASSNGCAMEEFIKALYPDAEFHYKGVIDFTIDGIRVELKSCQEFINDSNHSSGRRSGHFCFNDLQHLTLVENNGDYAFLVQRGGIPIFYVRIPASKINLGEFSGVKAVCWKTIIKAAI